MSFVSDFESAIEYIEENLTNDIDIFRNTKDYMGCCDYSA